jgi:hypothetical protein
MRALYLSALTTLFAASTASAAVLNFSDPTEVNLLERWNTNGTYALGFDTNSTGMGQHPVRAVIFANGGLGWRINSPQTEDLWWVRYEFDSPMVIEKVSVQFRDGFGPTAYTFVDDSGQELVSNSSLTNFTGSITHTFTPRTTSAIEFQVPKSAITTDFVEVYQLGAYLAAGQTLQIDGTYNVLYNETPASRDRNGGANDVLNWTDLTNASAAPTKKIAAGNPKQWVEYQFENEYEWVGMYVNFLTSGSSSPILDNAEVYVSETGASGTFIQILAPTDITPPSAGSSSLYVPFNNVSNLQTKYIRIFWDNFGGLPSSDITEIQLFGRLIGPDVAPVPEPASVMGLAMGTVMLGLRRRR